MPIFKSVSLWIITTLSAQAGIVNVLSPSVSIPEDGWDSNVKTSLQHLSGNENKLIFSSLAGTRWVAGPQQILVKGSADWGQTSGEVYSKKAFAHIRWKRELSGPWSAFIFGQVDHNEFRSLLMRDLIGTGVEAVLWSTDHTKIAMATAIMGETEWAVGEESTGGFALRSSNYLTLAWQPSDELSLGSTTFVQPLFSELSDVRGFQQLDLKVQLSAHLSWSSTLKIELDTQPAEDEVEPLDTSIKSGLVLSW
jgi:hypothetical protein